MIVEILAAIIVCPALVLFYLEFTSRAAVIKAEDAVNASKGETSPIKKEWAARRKDYGEGVWGGVEITCPICLRTRDVFILWLSQQLCFSKTCPCCFADRTSLVKESEAFKAAQVAETEWKELRQRAAAYNRGQRDPH